MKKTPPLDVRYDSVADILVIRFGQRRAIEGTDVKEGVAFLTDRQGRIAEIEIREASRRLTLPNRTSGSSRVRLAA